MGVVLLRKKYGAEEIVVITVDVGQGEEELRAGREKAEVLGIEPIVIDARQEFTAKWAYLVYHGMWFHPLKRAMDAFISETQSVVNGDYTVELYKGNINILYRESATSLFTPEIRSIKSRGFNQQMCADAAHVRGLPFEILARRGQFL